VDVYEDVAILRVRVAVAVAVAAYEAVVWVVINGQHSLPASRLVIILACINFRF
jgi:hypothetical protein